MSSPRPLPKGIYTPIPCFFQPKTEDLDLVAYKAHIQYTALNGTYPVISGTMGEAPHLSHSERVQLITTARSALDEISLSHIPIMAGVGETSTRESILLAQEAATAGADFAIAIAPGYYAGALMADMNSVRDYFVDVAKESPIPVMMYNFPAVTGGIDIDSDLIIEVAKRAPNVCGVKLTCGNVGKLTRITAVVESPAFKKAYPRKVESAPFLVIDGFIDFLLPSIASNASGAITGLANFAPKSCVKLWTLCQSSDVKTYEEARELQNITAAADGVAIKIGIPGMKMILNRLFGYGANPRRPLLPMRNEIGEKWFGREELRILLEYEKSL